MGTFDLIVLIIFVGFIGAGFKFGFIHTLGTIIGVVVGVVVAGNLYNDVANFFELLLFKPGVADAIAFITLFLVTSQLIGYLARMFDKGFKIIRFFPFVGSANRLGGAMLGFVEGALTIGVTLYVMSNFNISPEVSTAINNSPLAGLFMTIASIVTPLLPAALKIQIIG